MTNRGFLGTRVTVAALAAAVATLVFLAVEAGPVEAAFPGENGKIVYHAANILYWDLDSPVTDAPDVWVTESDGTGRANLTNTPGVHESSPAFSPDGTEVAFERAGSEYDAGDVWAMGADGSRQRNLTATPQLHESSPAWSPDGEKIAFVRGGDVWVMDADGGS